MKLLEHALAEAFYRGYLGAYDNGFRYYGEIFGIAYTWVEWLEYNIRRALKMEGEVQTVLMGVNSK